MNQRKIIPVVIGVIIKDGRYLLTKRAEWNPEDEGVQDHPWQFPGGALEFGESIEQCLHREIKEEVGVDLGSVTLLPEIFHEVRNNWHGVFVCFICELKDTKQKIRLNEEATEYAWLTIPEIKKLPILPKTIEIAELTEKQKNIID